MRGRVEGSVAKALAVGASLVALAVGYPHRVAEPAPPPSSGQTEVRYEGYRFNPSDPEIARRLAAGEDPATIPGVVVGSDPGPPGPSAVDETPDLPSPARSSAGFRTPR